MVANIELEDASAQRLFSEAPEYITAQLDVLLGQYGAVMQKLAKDNIASQGTTLGAAWQPPSKWIIAKKGQAYKLFQGITDDIKYTAAAGTLKVFFQSPGDWSLTEHQDGFSISPSHDRVTMTDLAYPQALGKNSSTFSFIWNNPAVVPPRRMWADEGQAQQKLTPLLDAWAKSLEEGLPT